LTTFVAGPGERPPTPAIQALALARYRCIRKIYYPYALVKEPSFTAAGKALAASSSFSLALEINSALQGARRTFLVSDQVTCKIFRTRFSLFLRDYFRLIRRASNASQQAALARRRSPSGVAPGFASPCPVEPLRLWLCSRHEEDCPAKA